MATEQKNKRKSSGKFFLLTLLAGLGFVGVVVCMSLFVYPPDPPIDTIVPGSSSGPAFVVQVIRPRVGLPLGGILPPQLFGIEESLSFDSTTPGAAIGSVDTSRIELDADEWKLILVSNGDGSVNTETHVVFEFVFEDSLRRVRCWPGDPVVGTLNITKLENSVELSGNFDIELAHCEDAETGKPLGWPPSPLVLHGSFDRLLISGVTEKQ